MVTIESKTNNIKGKGLQDKPRKSVEDPVKDIRNRKRPQKKFVLFASTNIRHRPLGSLILEVTI